MFSNVGSGLKVSVKSSRVHVCSGGEIVLRRTDYTTLRSGDKGVLKFNASTVVHDRSSDKSYHVR